MKPKTEKNFLNTFLTFAALSMFDSKPQSNFEPKEKKVVDSEEQTAKRNKKMGLKEFLYNEGVIWSLNEKTADAKALKRNWTKVK